MNPKHKQKSLVPQFDPNKEVKPQYINKDATIMSGWKREGNEACVFLSFRFIQHHFECFSDWSKEEMKTFWGFIHDIHNYTWQMILSQSGKAEKKAGFGYTPIQRDLYPPGFIQNIDPLVDFFELRVNQKGRVHCFRNESVCYICWLDRNHRIGN